jgi:hypothetical protein
MLRRTIAVLLITIGSRSVAIGMAMGTDARGVTAETARGPLSTGRSTSAWGSKRPKSEVELKTKGNMEWRSSVSSLSRTGRSDGTATRVPRS